MACSAVFGAASARALQPQRESVRRSPASIGAASCDSGSLDLVSVGLFGAALLHGMVNLQLQLVCPRKAFNRVSGSQAILSGLSLETLTQIKL